MSRQAKSKVVAGKLPSAKPVTKVGETTSSFAARDLSIRVQISTACSVRCALSFCVLQRRVRKEFARSQSGSGSDGIDPFALHTPFTRHTNLPCLQLDKLVGMAMLTAATTIFLYYTLWTLLMVGSLLAGSWY